MDWNNVRAAAQRPADPPAAALLETCWQLRAPSGRVISCGIFRDAAPGLVRCGFSEDDLLRSQRAAEIGTAREIANERRRAAVGKGFLELSEPGAVQ
jgi:hypothetical protein